MAERIPLVCTPYMVISRALLGRGRIQKGTETRRYRTFRLAVRGNILSCFYKLFTFHFDMMLTLRIRRLLTITDCWVFSENFASISSTCVQKECRFSVYYFKGKTLLGLPCVHIFLREQSLHQIQCSQALMAGRAGCWSQSSEHQAMMGSLMGT